MRKTLIYVFGVTFMLAFSGPFARALSDMERFYQAIDFNADGQYSKAVQIWKTLAASGHANSQFYLALMFEDGKGIAQNDQKAIFWYQKAAKQELKDAMINLGALYARIKHYHRAINTFRRALDLGYVSVQNNLAQLTHYLQDYQMVVSQPTKLRQTPSKQGKSLRALAAGLQGYEMKHRKGWVQVSLPGKPDVGWLPINRVQSDRIEYESGVKAHTFGNVQGAFRVWTKLAEKGHVKSQIMLARLYLKGEGVDQNDAQAIFWSEKALSQTTISEKVRAFIQQTIQIAKKQRGENETTTD